MRMRVFFSVLLFVSFAWLILSSGALTVAADSVPSGGHYLTVQETRQFIGDRIPFTYFNGSQYVDSEAVYQGSVTSGAETSEAPAGFVSGATYLKYSVSAPGVNTSASYITFHMQPSYSIYDTEWLYTCFALVKLTAVDVSSSAYQSPNSDWYIAGSQMNFANRNETSSGSGAYAYMTFESGLKALYIPIVHRSQSTFSAYSIDADFNGVGAAASNFYVMCPYVSGDAFGQSGTFASGSGSGVVTGTTSGSGGGSVDLNETNGLLGRIEIILSGIVDGIKGLFIPDDEFLSEWVDDMKQLLQDHLGGLYEAVTLSVTFMHQFETVQEKQSIYVPAASIPLSGTTFTIGPYTVPLKVDGLPSALYDGIAYIIDFIAIVLFLRMCRNKLEIFLNPDSEVVESDN